MILVCLFSILLQHVTLINIFNISRNGKSKKSREKPLGFDVLKNHAVYTNKQNNNGNKRNKFKGSRTRIS